MTVSEDILEQACTADCPRLSSGTCTYPQHEKDSCPRVKQILLQEQIDEASSDWDLEKILKEHLRTPYRDGK